MTRQNLHHTFIERFHSKFKFKKRLPEIFRVSKLKKGTGYERLVAGGVVWVLVGDPCGKWNYTNSYVERLFPITAYDLTPTYRIPDLSLYPLWAWAEGETSKGCKFQIFFMRNAASRTGDK